jgi:hypothetical protein
MSNPVANHLPFPGPLPWDVWTYMAHFVSMRVSVILSSTCHDLHQRYRSLIEDVIIPSELARMRIPFLPSLRSRLTTMGSLTDFFWQRTSEERREIRAILRDWPLQYYERLGPATIVLEEDVSRASDDPQVLFDLAQGQTNDRALILSNRVLFLSALNNRQVLIDDVQDNIGSRLSFPSLVIDAINDSLGLARQQLEEALPALLRLRMGLQSREVSLPAALRIIDRHVPDPQLRVVILHQLVLLEVEPGRRLETSIEIALLISDPKSRGEVLRSLVFQSLRKFPAEAILKIIQKIPEDQHEHRDACIALLSEETREPERALAIALTIRTTHLHIDALKRIAQRNDLSATTRKEVDRQVQRMETYKKMKG